MARPIGGWKGNANTLAQWALLPSHRRRYGNWTRTPQPDGQLRYNPGLNNDDIVEEKTEAVYIQFAMQGELAACRPICCWAQL